MQNHNCILKLKNVKHHYGKGRYNIKYKAAQLSKHYKPALIKGLQFNNTLQL